MINGVLEIVAAVLFAVIALNKGVDMIWITIAGVYLVCGVLNLAAHTLRNFRKQKAAEKAAAEKATKKAEEKAAAKSVPAVPAVPVAEITPAKEESING